MVIDYSKFAKLAEELEKEEEFEKTENRIQNRVAYQKRQDEKVEKWKKQQKALGKSEEEIERLRKRMYEESLKGCSHKHGGHGSHDHLHGIGACDHSEGHRQGEGSDKHAALFNENDFVPGRTKNVDLVMGNPYVHSESEHPDGGSPSDKEVPAEPVNVPNNAGYMGCGFASPEDIRAAEIAAKSRPPLEVRNQKKREAIFAAREDGNLHFRQGKYEIAEKIYDRALLIIADMYGHDDMEAMEELEGKISLNMAACSLKMKDWNKALTHCELARQSFDEKANIHPKIPYRITEAYIGLQMYDKASQSLEKFKQLAGSTSGSYIAMQERLDKFIASEDALTAKSEAAFAANFRKKARKKGSKRAKQKLQSSENKI